MCVHVCVRVCMCVCTRMCLYLCVYIHACGYVHMHVSTGMNVVLERTVQHYRYYPVLITNFWYCDLIIQLVS